MHRIAAENESPCQACGACCSYSQNWPRFTTEDDAALDLIPERFVNERLSGMRCVGDRCSARSLPPRGAPLSSSGSRFPIPCRRTCDHPARELRGLLTPGETCAKPVGCGIHGGNRG